MKYKNKNYTLIYASKYRHTSIGIIFLVYCDVAIFGTLWKITKIIIIGG